MDYTDYALKYCGIKTESEIQTFHYGCHIGLSGVKLLFEHRNAGNPNILKNYIYSSKKPKIDSTAILNNIANHVYDGEEVEELIKKNIPSLGEQKMLYDEIILLSDRKRCLTQDKEHTLPSYNECEVNIPVTELVNISHNIKPEIRPLKREDIKNAMQNNSEYNLDEVISGLVKYSLI